MNLLDLTILEISVNDHFLYLCNSCVTCQHWRYAGVWPSEEELAYYCLRNSEVFEHKHVIELGGGMTCLASFVVAQCSDASSVCCTDGNPVSVENIAHIIKHNSFDNCKVTSQ